MKVKNIILQYYLILMCLITLTLRLLNRIWSGICEYVAVFRLILSLALPLSVLFTSLLYFLCGSVPRHAFKSCPV